jgi:hypothetical protein
MDPVRAAAGAGGERPVAPRRRRRRRAPLAALVALATVASVLVVQAAGGDRPAAAAGPVPGDGTTMATAGASCWGILRDVPTSPTGTYWLSTPAMPRPAQFHCDMTTDGGGWVLIGRGREGWVWSPTGQQSPAAVRSTVSGPAAFTPASLDARTIDQLINGASPAALGDGIRVERARNAAGTSFQQIRMYPRFTSWRWMWEGAQLLDRIVVDGTSYTGSNTRDTFDANIAGQTTNRLAGVQGTRRMFTWAWDKNDMKAGFTYGKGGPVGSTSTTSHLWQARSTAYAIPFTRVWLRPKIGNATAFPAIPPGGYAAAPEPAGLKDRSELAPWGVVGIDHTNELNVEPWRTNVLAIEATPSRVFVGGRFTGVQQGPGATPIAQASLAAFAPDGTWISSFRPVIAGRVWDLATTSDGKLIVAGDFTSVNGVANTRGLAALDPTTGAVIPGWKARVSRVGGTEWRVRTLDVRGSWIYAGGLFDRVVDGTATVPKAVSNAMAVSVANGSLGTWKPTVNGSVIDATVSTDGTRVLLAGTFSSINGNATHGYFGITSIGTGVPIAGTGTWQPSTGSGTTLRYQQAVADLSDGRMIVGGSEHSTQLWNTARTSLLDASITKPGGDTQAIELLGGKAYVGCHCGGWIYQGTNNFTKPPTFRSIDAINLVGAWDTATWTYDTRWFPGSLKGAHGEGVWAMDSDANGCLWVGGDLVRGAYSGVAATDWLGGFARFCPLDAAAPTEPGSLTLTSTGTSRKLTWTAAADPGGGTITYDVIREGRVIATTSAATRTFTDPSAPAGTRYTVRTVDARGNRSGSPVPVTAG